MKRIVKFLCLMLLMIIGSVGQVWAHSSHTGTGTVYTNGNGKVYASSNSTSPQGGDWSTTEVNATATIQFSCSGSSSNDGWKDAYAFSDPNDGYYLEGWYTNAERTQKASGGNHFQVGVNKSSGNAYPANKLYAKFAAIPVSVSEAPQVNAIPEVSKLNVAVFKTREDATKADFNEPEFTGINVGTWEKDSWSVEAGYLTVNYYFTGSEVGNYADGATLHVSSKGGVAADAVIAVAIEEESPFDAILVDSEGNEIDASKREHLADVIAQAEEGQTVRLLRDLSSATITKSIVLDLNDHSIIGTTSGVLTINGTGIEVTLKDDAGHGVVSSEAALAGDLAAVKVTKGSLILQNVTINCNNTSTDNNSARTFGVDIAAGAEFVMKGGAINADCASTKGSYGIYERGTATTSGSFVMNGGTITANGKGSVRGVLIYGTMVMNDGATIKAPGVAGIGVMVHISGSNGPGALTMNGGVVDGLTVGVQVSTAACKSTINNGSIKGAKALNVVEANTTGVVVKGGLFEGTITTATNGILKGGYYTAQPAAAAIATNYLSYPTLEGTAIRDAGYTYGVGGSEEGAIVCKVLNGNTGEQVFFTSIAAALDFTMQYTPIKNDKGLTIVILADCTLPAGYYTLPAHATLLVPYKEGTGKGADQVIGATASHNQTYADPSKFKCLTFAKDARLDVYGKLEVSAQSFNNSQGAPGNGNPTGKYGQIKLDEGSKITLQSGSFLYAWGYITRAAAGEEGEIDARRGSTVYEDFQVYDWKGGSASNNLRTNSEKIFIVNQYYIQNIEVPIRFRPGSKELTSFGVVVSSVPASADNIGIIGLRNKKDKSADDVALFLLDDQDNSEDTWVMKDYDEGNDRQVYTINSAAAISSVLVKVSLINMNSANFILPITNNMTIHLLTGTMKITQDVALLPGAVIENDKESTVTIEKDKTLYLYDYEDWGLYAYHSSGNSAVACPVKYSPAWGTSCPRATGSAASLGDAKLNIHGTLDVKGYLRTTEGGANIFSNVADAGTIIYSADAKEDPDPNRTTDTEIWQVKGTATKESKHTIPALLQNEDAPATETAGTLAGKSFCYLDIDGDDKGQWTSLHTDGCFVIDDTDPSNKIIYIKPGAYVAVTSQMEDKNHLYRSVTGNRLFIVLHSSDHKSCQWWEVTKTEEDDKVYYCEDNDTYYYYDNLGGKWMVKTIAVRWQNYDGELIGDPYEVPFGGHPQYLGTSPKRPATTYYTYSFAGWYPEITDDVRLYEDMTYVAQYEEHEIRYTVTFVDENGKTIESQFVKVGEIPVCNFQPTKQGYYLFWRNKTTGMPIAAVSGNVTYEAYYEDIPPTTFTVVFQNYNGAILKLADGSTDAVYEVEEGVKPAYTGVIPTKDPTADKEFVFAGWTPDIVPTTKDMTYVAKFDATPRKYTITFLAEDGETVLDKQSLGYGEVPVCRNTPTKNPDVANYYVALWADNEGNNVPLSAVTKATTYTHAGFAAFKNTLRVTVSAGAHGSVTMDGSSSELSKIYEYGDEVTIAATATDAHYHFAQWSDGSTANPRVLLATQTTNLVAEFAIDQVVVTFADEEGKTIATTNVDYNTVPAYVGATPIKANTCGMYYTFTGWSPAFTAATVAQTYTAQFKGTKNPALISYQVAFDGNGATSGSMPNQGFDKGSEQKLTKNAFAKVLYTTTFDFNGNGQANQVVTSEATFAGWNVDATHYADEAVVRNLTEVCDGVVTMVAEWNNTVPAVTLPVPAEWAGHTFDGWYDGENKVTTYTPSTTKTLTAHWTAKMCKITWMDDEGNVYGTDEVPYGEVPSYGSIPTKAGGYTFVAWTPTIVKAVIDAEYVANFRDNSKATVIFNLMGKGENFDDQEKIEAKITAPEDVYTTGYHVSGWYKEPTLVNEWNFASDLMPEDGITLYAKWEANQWTISFDADYSDAPAIAGIPVSYDAAIAGMPTPEREGYDFKGWFTEKEGKGSKYENGYYYDVDDNLPLFAKWEIKRFNITFTNLGGLMPEITNGFEWGTKPEDLFDGTPVKNNTEDYIYEFVRWEPALAIVTEDATYTAVFSETARAGRDLVESSTWIVTEADKASSLTITKTGSVLVNESFTLTDLIIKSDGNKSGQLGATNSQLHVTNAHFDLTLNAQTRTWYAVAVPWNVDSETGISANGRTLTLGRDFDIIYYDGAARAAAQPNAACWRYVEDDANKTIVPGKFYLMFFARPYETIRFTKKAGADIIYTSNEVAMTAYPVSNGADPDLDYGWNGIANPKLYYAYMNAGVEYGTVLKSGNIDDGSFSWDVCTLASTQFVVGSPVFVQTSEDGNASVSREPIPSSVAARVMANNSKTATYEVRIAPADAAAYSDRLYVSADENATGSYTIGKDLLKMGVASKSAQMWVNQYNSLLAVNTAVLHNDMANFSLGISAPQEGMYTISLADVPVGRELYLLQNGSVIANLSMGAYTIYLQKGTSSEYSLRIGAVNAPGQATDLEEAVVDASTVVEKVVINGKLYIITEGHVYDAVGRMVK